ncbi:MAG: GDP-L-fucose synthetase [Thermoleophilia bacterium]|nr:GDP-L-fucose synthetase [Thermoleophilia bacterium]
MSVEERVYVAGHRGLVGSAIVRRLAQDGIEPIIRTHAELDLTDPRAVEAFFAAERPTSVYLAAAKVGGIIANRDFPVDFGRDNLLIQTHVMEAAHRHDVEKLTFLGSSCIYPRDCPQPIKEEYLLTGPLEPSNEPYALAKIIGVRMCQAYCRQHGRDFISVMPTNLYGPGDNFDPELSHVIPGMLRRFHEAKLSGADEVVIWGTGTPRREFLHVDDMADATVHLARTYSGAEHVNVGWGEDVTISDLARTIAEVVGFDGALRFDTSKPDGTPRKLLDTSALSSLGWKPSIALRAGLDTTYSWFVLQGSDVRVSAKTSLH